MELTKRLFFLILIGVIVWATTPDLYGQSTLTTDPVTGVTKPSGGSKADPVSSDGVVLGPHFKQKVTQKVIQPTTENAVIGITFEGFDFDDNATENSGNLFIPPDPIGAVGTDRVIAVVNTMIEARDKGGTLLFRDALADFFAPLTPLTFTFDPKVIYDQYEDRFVVVTLERVDTGNNPDSGNESRILLAVSKTGTPATATSADWEYHEIDAEMSISGIDYWADYPGFEADEEAIYITVNMFPHGTVIPVMNVVRLWIVDKGVGSGGFYDGGPAAVTVHDPYAVSGSVAATTMPCQVFGNSGVGPGIGTFLLSYSSLTVGGAGGDEFVQVVRVDDPLGTPTFAQEFVNIGDIEDVGGGFGSPDLPDAPQSGTGVLIEVNDSRALDCVWRNGAIWLTTTINPNSGTDTGQTTAHWFRLNTSAVPGGSITLDDQGDIGGEDIAAGTFTFFPSVAVNSVGSAQFGFSASAPTIFPGAFVTGREAGDPAGTVQASETVHAGEDFYIRIFASGGGVRNRWGDYSGIALDPINDNLFWVFNQYAALRGTVIDGEDGRWGTAWANSAFASAGSAVDVYFLVDLSGSFADDLPVFKAEAPGIISTLRTSFPNSQFGLGSFEDYPISPFGSAVDGDVAYRQNIDLTIDTAAVEAVIAGLFTRFGDDGPQSQLPALFQSATGAGQDLTAEGFPGASIDPGLQANFRDGATKLFLLWTDAAFHLPGDPGDIPYPGPSFDDTVAAIMALDPPQVLGVVSGDDLLAIEDLRDMALATGAIAPPGGVDCDGDGLIDIPEGEALVCTTPPTGEGVGEAMVRVVVAAVEAATPVAQCKDVTVPTDPGVCAAASVSVNNGSFDPDGGPVDLTQFPPGPYSLGDTPVTLLVTDETGLSDSCEAIVTVEDLEAPIIENVTSNPNVLWPPKHKMVQVNVNVLASDNCDTEPACSIVSVSSNEHVNGLDDGNTSPDWEEVGDLTVNLRAERSGTGDGRIYTITVECIDDSGNNSTETVDVTVPIDLED